MVSPAKSSMSSAVSFMTYVVSHDVPSVVWRLVLSWRKVVLFGCMFSFLATFAWIRMHSCSFSDTVRGVQEVCDLYHAKKIAGPMCASLCDESRFSYSYCGNDAESRKTVLIMDCNGCDLGHGVNKVVLKMAVNRTAWQTTTDTILEHPYSFENAVERLNSLLKYTALNYTESDQIDDLLVMCFGDLRQGSREAELAMIRSVVAIVLQHEYVKMITLKKHGITPDIYGYCGPAYFMEYTAPLVEAGYVFPLGLHAPQLHQYRIGMRPWSDRARLALDILQTMRRFDSRNEPLDVCDLKTRNVGINYENRPVFLDLDYTVYRTAYDRPCKGHIDCDFDLCGASCNATTHRCARTDNNLNKACRNLLSENKMLAFPPWSVRQELSEALNHCAHPSKYYNTPELNKAGPDIADRLEAILKRSLEE